MFGDIPAPEWADFQIFKGNLVNSLGTGQGPGKAYSIPPQASMLYFLAIGPGGRGGNGATGAAGTARGGGAGGGSGGISRLLIPAKLLPSTIYLRPGVGGVQGLNTGQSTTVSLLPNLSGGGANANDLILLANVGGDGTNGTTGAAAAGAAATAMAASVITFGNLGLWTAVAGQAGGAGGNSSGAAGSAVTWGGTVIIPISGGAGGGGTPTGNTDFAGGAITGTTVGTQAPLMPTVAGGLAAAGRGNNGMSFFYAGGAFRGTGGSGGGTAGAAGTGGAGGDGGYGCGGGGGGAGVTGGTGGKGGPGIIFIWAW